MNENVMLPKETTKVLMDLTGEARMDIALTVVIRDYAKHKLGEVESQITQFEEKYRMSFDAYKKIWDTEDNEKHYTQESESDYLEWEALATRCKRMTNAN